MPYTGYFIYAAKGMLCCMPAIALWRLLLPLPLLIFSSYLIITLQPSTAREEEVQSPVTWLMVSTDENSLRQFGSRASFAIVLDRFEVWV